MRPQETNSTQHFLINCSVLFPQSISVLSKQIVLVKNEVTIPALREPVSVVIMYKQVLYKLFRLYFATAVIEAFWLRSLVIRLDNVPEEKKPLSFDLIKKSLLPGGLACLGVQLTNVRPQWLSYFPLKLFFSRI